RPPEGREAHRTWAPRPLRFPVERPGRTHRRAHEGRWRRGHGSHVAAPDAVAHAALPKGPVGPQAAADDARGPRALRRRRARDGQQRSLPAHPAHPREPRPARAAAARGQHRQRAGLPSARRGGGASSPRGQGGLRPQPPWRPRRTVRRGRCDHPYARQRLRVAGHPRRRPHRRRRAADLQHGRGRAPPRSARGRRRMSTVIEKDMVLEGPLWPEPVRVLSVEHFGTMLQVDAVGTRSRQFYAGIIVTAAQVETLKVVSSAKGMDFSGDPEAFHLAIEAMRIRLAYEYDPHFAVNASTITPLPHQLDAVYRYMLKSPLVRFLLADDPGAGKTIMAGLLLKELRFRGLADRVLVVVPPLVARQWQEELSEKF